MRKQKGIRLFDMSQSDWYEMELEFPIPQKEV